MTSDVALIFVHCGQNAERHHHREGPGPVGKGMGGTPHEHLPEIPLCRQAHNLVHANELQLTLDGGYIMAGLGEMWLIKTNANGDTVWTRRSGGPDGSETPWVEQTLDGGYIITGNISGTFADVGLIKTNSLSETEWIKTYDRGGDE